MSNSDLVVEIDFSKRGVFLHDFKEWRPYHYFRPCWVYGDSLFVWCDEHMRWNEHGVVTEDMYSGEGPHHKDERVPGTITSRVPHHSSVIKNAGTKYEHSMGGEHCEGEDFYCMGEAPPEVAKIVRRYHSGEKAKHTPPPTRRVYPKMIPVVNTSNADTLKLLHGEDGDCAANKANTLTGRFELGSPDDLITSGTSCSLKCPICGHEHTHVQTAYTRSGCSKGEAIFAYPGTENRGTTPARRSALCVLVEGECGHRFEIIFQQSKGITFIEVGTLKAAEGRLSEIV